VNPFDDSRPTDAWIDERLEAFLDGELPTDERARMERTLAEDASWRVQLDLATRIHGELRATPTPAVPAGLTRAILSRTRRAQRIQVWSDLWHNGPATLLARLRAAWQPALALTSVAALATFLYLAGGLDATRTAPQAAPDVEKALAEVKWTLGYISKTGRKTGESVQSAIGPLLQGSPYE
jgi:anti-sigma factor RsiW